MGKWFFCNKTLCYFINHVVYVKRRYVSVHTLKQMVMVFWTAALNGQEVAEAAADLVLEQLPHLRLVDLSRPHLPNFRCIQETAAYCFFPSVNKYSYKSTISEWNEIFFMKIRYTLRHKKINLWNVICVNKM